MNKPAASTAAERAAAAWGVDLPDWIAVLAVECDRTSQNKVAERLGYSGAAISQVVNNRYKAPLTAIEQAVRGVLMNALVQCPALGETPADVCLAFQRAEYSGHNPQRIRVWRACQTCANRRDKHAQ